METKEDDLVSTATMNNNCVISSGNFSSTEKKEERNTKNFVTVQSFVLLNGAEREITWDSHNKNGAPEFNNDKELAQAVKRAEKEISEAVANNGNITEAKAIVFKDENGRAPPITVTVLGSADNSATRAGSMKAKNKVDFHEVDLHDEKAVEVVNILEETKNFDEPDKETGSFFGCYRPLRRTLQNVAQRKRDEQRAQFQALADKHKLSPEAQEILSLDWNSLISQLQSRKLTAVQVLSAFIAKSLESTRGCNAVTEFNPKAMEIAEALDKLPQVKGPLHGVPFCVKDDTNLEDMDSTLGFAKNCYKPARKSAALVLTLEALGGVPFCKTNVPQTLLCYGSDNPVWGVTTSSHNNKLGPGGSSSGTGALVGTFGSFFGTGTDIGGSLRIPAHFNGVASLKPTSGRLSVTGVSATLPNIMGLDATTGIIGRNAQVVTAVHRAMLENGFHSAFDPLIPPLPWNEKAFSSSKKLRIGYFTQFPFFPPIGDTVAVVESAIEALKRQGHTLVPMDVPDGGRIMRVAANFLLADQSKTVIKLWQGEQVAQCVELNKIASKCPTWLLKLVAYLMERKTLLPFLYSHSLGSLIDAGSFKSADLWDNTGEKKKLTEEILAEWSSKQLDLCICPVMPFPAVPHHLPGMLPPAAVYTMAWNVVNFPAGVVKFGMESGKNINNYDSKGDQALIMSQKAVKESIGSPIGVQIVGLPFKEELVLRVMEELDNYAAENKILS